MRIIADFPGGNIKVISVKDNTVNIEQELRGTDCWWFYWCFRVDDPVEGEVVFKFHNDTVVPIHGPATSADGINWIRHQEGFIDHTSFQYTFKKGEKSRYFSFSYPYTAKDFNRFLGGFVMYSLGIHYR